MKLILISDIHGCYYTLLRLLAKCPKDHQVVFCGDLVDRGPHSKKVVAYAIKHKIPTVCGNHDDMMIDYLEKTDRYSEGVWYQNGGSKAVRSYIPRGKDTAKFPASHIRWLKNLPLYLTFDKLMVSHTGHGDISNRLPALWHREHNFPDDGFFRVFGHTPEQSPTLTKRYAMIDTGAAYGHLGMGNLTAFIWPTGEIIQQEFNEKPINNK